MVQQFVTANNENMTNSDNTLEISNNIEENEKYNSEENQKNDEDKETFTWPEKAVLLFLELYREREQEFTTGMKRHNKLWSEIASELKNSNYNVSPVQVQNKMSGLKRTYKKIKDSNAKSGNYNSSWIYYSALDSLFGEKRWVSPPAIASSDGPNPPSELASSSSSIFNSSSSMDFELQNSASSKPKKRKVEVILDTYISDLKTDREQKKEERKLERKEKEERKEQRWESYKAEKREMHRETSDIQRSLVELLGKLIEKTNK